jgi:hypothetical protein
MTTNDTLAKNFAEGKGSKVLKYRLEPDPLDETVELHVIILEDGRKFKLTEKELKAQIQESEAQDESKPKSKRKE